MPESPLTSTIPCLVKLVLADCRGSLPVVTVSWAQSSNGAIAPADRTRVTLSSPESMALTHRLRSLHSAILVGIGTVLADDPQLTVRLVEGSSPQPVVLDSRLRFPLSARLLGRRDRAPWIFHGTEVPAARARELSERGARLFALPAGEAGLPLGDVLAVLGTQGMESLMVEGGALVLRSFLAGGLARQAVITVSPREMEGIRVLELMPRFAEMSQERHGGDTVTWGRF